MILKKFIIGSILFIFSMVNVFGYTAQEHIELNFYASGTWTEIYNVPDGKDFFIYRLYSKDKPAKNLQIRNSTGATLVDGNFEENIYDMNITISDSIEVYSTDTGQNFIIFGFLIDEEEDIAPYIQGEPDAWNKHIFNKETIDEIYLWEGVIMLSILLFTFFRRLLGYKYKRKSKFL